MFYLFKQSMDINKDLESVRLLMNNAPSDDFLGLSPSEMHTLLYHPFKGESVLKINGQVSDSTLKMIPFFRSCEEFLKILFNEGSPVKLTPTGRLPRRICKELYSKEFILDYGIESGISKQYDEEDLISIKMTNILSQITKAVVYNEKDNKLYLTTKGQEYLENRQKFFNDLFENYCLQYNWGYHDRYGDFPIGQFGFGFTFYMLKKFGNEKHPKSFYAEKYIRAFPKMLDQVPESPFSTKEQTLSRCYSVRTFERFLEWFGMVTIEEKEKIFTERNLVMKTGVFDDIVSLN